VGILGGRAGTARRLAVAVLAGPLVLLGVLMLGALPAAAHAALLSTNPPQGAQLSAAPRDVTLTFTEEVGLGARAVEVADARGQRVNGSPPRHAGSDSRTVQVALPPGLGRGSYTVTWRVVSADGHPVSGTFAFGVGVPAGTVAEQQGVDPAIGVLRDVVEFLAYVGAALVIGCSAFLFALWPEGQADVRMRRLMTGGVAVAAAGSLGALVVQGPYVAGRSLGGLVDAGLLGETFGSTYGRPLLLRVLAVALSVPVLGLWPRLKEGEDAGPGAVAAAGNALLLAASFALTGHAAEASPRVLGELADGVHLLAAGTWLGGLAVLLAAYLPSLRAARAGGAENAGDGGAGPVLQRWSAVAMTCVALLLATGSYQAWRETRSLDALTGTTYGRLLVAKLCLVAVLLGAAAVARALLARRRAGSAGTTGATGSVGGLRRAVGVEALVGIAVLAVTSVLVATPPARSTFGPPVTVSAQARDVEGVAIRFTVDVDATRVGPQTLRLHTYAPTGEALPFTSATGDLRREGDAAPVRLTFAPVSDGVAVASGVVVPAPGRWTLTVQVLTVGTTDYAGSVSYQVR